MPDLERDGLLKDTFVGGTPSLSVCAMDGKYVLTWLNMNPLSIRAMVFPLPTSDLTRRLEQTMILPGIPGLEAANLVASPYGGFVIPGSTFGNFHIVVSQWYDPRNYRIMQYKVNMLS